MCGGKGRNYGIQKESIYALCQMFHYLVVEGDMKTIMPVIFDKRYILNTLEIKESACNY